MSTPPDYDFPALLQPAPLSGRFSHPDYYIWCGSAIRGDDGLYHLYYSRWPRAHGFNAWVTHSEVAHATSPTPFGPWEHRDLALPPRGQAFWDGLCTHNPTIQRFGGLYYLYYMGNRGDGRVTEGLNWTHRNNQRVGVAVADHPEGPWTRFEQPLIEPTEGFPDTLCMANPSVTARPGGGYLMVYKGVAQEKPLPFGGPVRHYIALADRPEGPFAKQSGEIFAANGKDVMFPAEDPFIWAEGGHYYAIVKDMGGHFTGNGRSLALFEAADGRDWKLAPRALVSTTEVLWEDGRRQPLEHLERPQLLIEDGQPIALLCAAMQKEGGVMETFNVQIPLSPR